MIVSMMSIFAATIVAQYMGASAVMMGVPRQTCAELGWKIKSGIHGTNTEVCASSEITDQCFSKENLNYDQTKNLCAAAGARLCTSTELESNIAPPTKCNTDTNLRMVWSSTSCTNNVGGHMVVVMGKLNVGQPPVCVADTSSDYTMRCCSDRVTSVSLPWVKISLQPSAITQNVLAITVMVTGFSGNSTDVRCDTTLVGYNDVGLVVGVKSTTPITLATHKTVVATIPDFMLSVPLNINQRKFTSVDRYILTSVLVDMKTGATITHTSVSGNVLPMPTVDDVVAKLNEIQQQQQQQQQQVSRIQMGDIITQDETTSNPKRVCVDTPTMWQDKDHMSCQDYAVSEWCTRDGFGTSWDETWGNFSDYAAPMLSDNTKLFSASEVCCQCGGGEYKLSDDVDSDLSTSTTTEPDVDQASLNENEILDTNTAIIIGLVCGSVCIVGLVGIKCFCFSSSSQKGDETNWYIHKVMRLNRNETNFTQSEADTPGDRVEECSFDFNAIKLLRGTTQHKPSSRAVDGVFRPTGAGNDNDPALNSLKKVPTTAKNVRAPSELFSTHPVFVQMQQVQEQETSAQPALVINEENDDDDEADDGYLSTLPDCEIVQVDTTPPLS